MIFYIMALIILHTTTDILILYEEHNICDKVFLTMTYKYYYCISLYVRHVYVYCTLKKSVFNS